MQKVPQSLLALSAPILILSLQMWIQKLDRVLCSSQNIEDLKSHSSTMIPLFDFEKNKRSGSKELIVSEDCGVVSALIIVHIFPITFPYT